MLQNNYPSNLEVFNNPSEEKLTKETAIVLEDLFKQNLRKKILFLTSGGSALKLVEYIDPKIITKDFTISVLDERFSKEPNINNFAQLTKTQFFNQAKINGANFIKTMVQKDETLEQFANHFELELKNWKQSNPEGVVIITMGMGPDGHTAGIMPFPEDPELFKQLFCSENLVIGYDAKDKNEYPLRVTASITFLIEKIDYAIIFVLGSNKRDALEKLFDEKVGVETIPAKVIFEMKDVSLFTDIELSINH